MYIFLLYFWCFTAFFSVFRRFAVVRYFSVFLVAHWTTVANTGCPVEAFFYKIHTGAVNLNRFCTYIDICHILMFWFFPGSFPYWIVCLLFWLLQRPQNCRPTGDQEVAGSTPAEVGNILSWRLIMKYFLRPFSPFRWFKKGSCQFLAKECAQYWLTA